MKIRATILHETDKALLVRRPDETREKLWIPKSWLSARRVDGDETVLLLHSWAKPMFAERLTRERA